MTLSPDRNNIQSAGIIEWAMKAEGDTGYAVFPFLRHGVVGIETLWKADSEGKPQPYAYEMTVVAEFLPTYSLLRNASLLTSLGTKLIDHRIALRGGGYISSAPTTSTPSPTGFGVKWKFVSDGDADQACYLEMIAFRRLLPSEYIQVLTSANADMTPAISGDTFYSFTNFSSADIIPAGVTSFELGSSTALGDTVNSLRNSKYTAELQTTQDDRGCYVGHSVKIDFEAEPLETEETELQKWPVIVGRTNYSKITFISGLQATLKDGLGFKYDYVSDTDMQDVAHGKIIASGIVGFSDFVKTMEVNMNQWGGSCASPGVSATSYFIPIGFSTNQIEDLQFIPVTVSGTFDKLFATIYRSINNNSARYTVTVRKMTGGVSADTALTKQVGPAKAGFASDSDTTHSFTAVAGDLICIKIVGDGSGNVAESLSWNFNFTPS